MSVTTIFLLVASVLMVGGVVVSIYRKGVQQAREQEIRVVEEQILVFLARNGPSFSTTIQRCLPTMTEDFIFDEIFGRMCLEGAIVKEGELYRANPPLRLPQKVSEQA